MLARLFSEFFKHHLPDYRKKRFILAVSGGMDSMVMLDLFQKEKLSFVVAHCNFHLRLEESDGDAEFVAMQCKALAVPFHIRHFDMENEKRNEGIQLRARTLRYSWFETLRMELNFDFICTAHHERDNAETLIYRFMNGAFPESMKGIAPINEKLVRPLLTMPYESLLNYAGEHSIAFRTDSSNLKLDYTRNKIRHNILPAFHKVFGEGFEERIAGIPERYNDYYALIRQLSDRMVQQRNNWFEISKQALKNREGRTALLYESIKKYGFNWDQCRDICTNLDREQGACFENDDRSYALFFANEVLELVPMLHKEPNLIQQICIDEKEVSVADFNGIKIQFKIIQDFSFGNFNDGLLYLDAGLLNMNQLHIRYRNDGDAFVPLGMNGKKSVADFLKDLKLTPAQKYFQVLLCESEKIIALPGYRIDHQYRITDETKRVLSVEIVS